MPKTEIVATEETEFSKQDGQLRVQTPAEPVVQVFSYDRILNEIQSHTEELAKWNALKDEADKLKLKR